MINYNNYDLIVVGAGITGATAAYIASHEYRLKVLVLEKKDLGGLLSDYIDHDTGMLVQSYGTHFIHTNNKHIYDFLSQIVPMIPFTLNSRTIVDQMEVQMPFNLQVVDALYDKEKAEEIKLKIMKIFQFEEFIPLTDMLRCRDADIASFAEKLVREHYIPLYKKKHGFKRKVGASVMQGLCFHNNYDDKCYYERYQMLPKDGFSNLIQTMLSDPKITVVEHYDFCRHVKLFKNAKKQYEMWCDGKMIKNPVLYTGVLDDLFGYQYGRLEYTKVAVSFIKGKKLQSATINHPKDKEYYSETDFSYFNSCRTCADTTVISRERFDKNGFMAYPEDDAAMKKRSSRYLKEASKVKNLFLAGRLAGYQFKTIADCITEAMNVFSSIPFKNVDLTPDYVKCRRPVDELIYSGDNFKKKAHVKSILLKGDLNRKIPELTVTIPTYKRLDLLKRTLASVMRQDISKDKFDILILDNDPEMDNETFQYVKTLNWDNLYYYKNDENIGAYGNQNRCIELARTEWISMVHDDDVIFPNALRWALESKEYINDPKLGMIIPRQLQAHSEREFTVRMSEKGISDKNLIKKRVAAFKPSKKRLIYYYHLYEKSRRRYWKVSKFDCYMVPFLYPATTYGTLINRKAMIDVGGYGEGYPIDDNFCCNKMSDKYNCYLCGETWGVYSYYTADVNKPKSALQFVDAVLQYRHYMEKHHFLCWIAGKFIRNGSYTDAVRKDYDYGIFQRGYNISKESYPYYKEYESSSFWCRKSAYIQKCWDAWILLRAILFGRRIPFALIKKCNGEHA